VWKVLHGARSFQDATSLQISSRSSSPQDRKRQLIKAVGALLLIPVGTLVFLQILMNLSGVENLPRWLRSLGVVTELQGKLFLAGFVATILMIAGMIYAVLTLFEVLNGKDELSGLKQIRWG
jgi:heme/copper-type cytochrome/quinol oxidase subunit 1